MDIQPPPADNAAERHGKITGIVGGLGPHAHILFERRLLDACGDCASEQDYPAWSLISRPGVPDRTAALIGQGPSPVPDLLDVLGLLAPTADFAVIPCNTAHAFLDELVPASPLPIVSMIHETVRFLTRPGERRTIGLLGTSGLLSCRVYQRVTDALGAQLDWVTLLDLPDGEARQENLVTSSLYGRLYPDGKRSGGIKCSASQDPITGRPYKDALSEAANLLRQAGAVQIIAGCTEIPLSLEGAPDVVDPMAVTAESIVAWVTGTCSPEEWRQRLLGAS